MMKFEIERLTLSPILGFALDKHNSSPLDLSRSFLEEAGMDHRDVLTMSKHIYNGSIRYGGYLEERNAYERSELFRSTAGFRNIHLGVDIWASAGSPIFAPLAGRVVGAKDNDAYGDYGPTIILAHQLGALRFYSLYGHLSRTDLEPHDVGDEVSAGGLIGHMGAEEENGGWLPHVHVQLIRDLQGCEGDYPGVCAIEDLDFYRTNCPDPKHVIV